MKKLISLILIISLFLPSISAFAEEKKEEEEINKIEGLAWGLKYGGAVGLGISISKYFEIPYEKISSMGIYGEGFYKFYNEKNIKNHHRKWTAIGFVCIFSIIIGCKIYDKEKLNLEPKKNMISLNYHF